MADQYTAAREAWRRTQEHYGLQNLRLVGTHVVITPEQDEQLKAATAKAPAVDVTRERQQAREAQEMNLPADDFIQLPIVVLEPGQEIGFRDGWRARNRNGVIQTVQPCAHCSRNDTVMGQRTSEGETVYLCHAERDGRKADPDCYHLVTTGQEPLGERTTAKGR